MIRVVLFDVDDTLCDDRGQMVRCIRETADLAARFAPRLDARELAEAYGEIADRFWFEEFSLAPPPPLDEIRRLLWGRALTAVGETCFEGLRTRLAARYDALRKEPIAPFPGTVETLAALKARGFALAALTNGFSETHVPKIEALCVAPLLASVFTPDRLGVAKPDSRAFHRACAQLGFLPGEGIHVGDSPTSDIDGAKRAGLRAAWFNPHGNAFPAGCLAPDVEISTLPELLDYLS